MRHLSHYANIAVALHGSAIVRVSVPHHDDARDGERSGTQCFQCEKSVIDGAQRRARHDEYGQRQLNNQINHQFGLVDGHENAACALHDPRPLRLSAC